nr:cilia- and flagella-associated protein 36-like [Lytechinus pictus]
MAEQEFIMDGVIGFLQSPIWRVPVLSFIEHKCIAFNPDEENKIIYTEIYEEYGNLVEMLLQSFLEDLNINAASFVEVCNAFKTNQSQSNKTVFEQVYAAQDFQVFKAMMTQKNIELELQALNMLQQRSGQIPNIMKPGESTPIAHSQAQEDNEEERILQEVLALSEKEYKEEMKKSKKQSSTVNSAMDKSLASGKEVEQLKIHKQKEEEMLEKTLKLAISEGPKPAPTPVSTSKTKTPKPQSATSLPKSPTPSTSSSASTGSKSSRPVTGQEAAANWLLSAKAEAANPSGGTESRVSNLSTADPSDLEKRAQYLKQQRDILIAKKKSAREKSLDAYEQTQVQARPKSSRAARQATQGNVKLDGGIDEKQLATRRALAECLKSEVIDK